MLTADLFSYRIVKVPHRPADLEQRLRRLGWHIKGTSTSGPFYMANFRTQFGVPDQWMPIGAIAIGHPDPASDPVPPGRAGDRKSLEELVHRGRW
jgi:hypothetical protein